VVADHHIFMELAYYAPAPMRSRLIYPVDRELDMRYLGQDTGALLMSALSRHSQLPIVPIDAVLAAHPRFILAALGRDYVPAYLRKRGYDLIPIAPPPSADLFDVRSPGSSASSSK
jgi:hypothetical protein